MNIACVVEGDDTEDCESNVICKSPEAGDAETSRQRAENSSAAGVLLMSSYRRSRRRRSGDTTLVTGGVGSRVEILTARLEPSPTRLEKGCVGGSSRRIRKEAWIEESLTVEE